jgi:hypothetical protein
MKKLIVRSLVGSAVLLACGQIDAATVALNAAGGAPTLTSSIEGNAAAATANGAASVKLRTMEFTLAGSGYVDGDVVTVTLGGGGSLRLGSVGAIDSTVTCTELVAGNDVDANAMTLKLTGVTATTATYVVEGRDSDERASEIRCDLANWEVLASSLTSYKVLSINWSAATAAGVVHDVLRRAEGNPAATTSVHVSDTQFQFYTLASSSARTALIKADATSTTVGPLQRFANSTTNAAVETYGPITYSSTANVVFNPFTGADEAGQNVGLATADTVVTTYTGDFSFVDNDGNGCTLADLSRGWGQITIGGGATSVAVNAACTTITTRGAPRNETISFAVNALASTSGAKTISAQSITVSSEFAAGATAVSTVAASGLTFRVNGFTAQVPYMPYGPGISRIMYITNRTATSGAVSISAVNEAGVSCATTRFPAVTAGAGRVTLLSAAVDAGIAACYGADFNGKVLIDITAAIAPQSGDSLSATAAITNGAITGRTNAGGAVATGDGVVGGVSGSIGAAATLAQAASSGTISGTVSRGRSNADVYSAYNVNGNRITVINTSNGR